MLKVTISKIRASVDLEISRSGSVLRGTVAAKVPSVRTRYEIESPDGAEAVARVLRAARDGCFVKAALAEPVDLPTEATLNGKPIDL